MTKYILLPVFIIILSGCANTLYNMSEDDEKAPYSQTKQQKQKALDAAGVENQKCRREYDTYSYRLLTSWPEQNRRTNICVARGQKVFMDMKAEDERLNKLQK